MSKVIDEYTIHGEPGTVKIEDGRNLRAAYEAANTAVHISMKGNMHNTKVRDIPDVLRSLERMSMNGKRSKPLYSDCWMIDTDDMDIIERYDIPFGSVIIGNSADG
ncbi:MAG: hypothetical protein LBE47_00530 [Methanomassiliicoccaceae archaeon]|jgi:hypothetical protein|nr:hypothetical protein [Methanomassiliicoccaceae archaeon]